MATKSRRLPEKTPRALKKKHQAFIALGPTSQRGFITDSDNPLPVWIVPKKVPQLVMVPLKWQTNPEKCLKKVPSSATRWKSQTRHKRARAFRFFVSPISRVLLGGLQGIATQRGRVLPQRRLFRFRRVGWSDRSAKDRIRREARKVFRGGTRMFKFRWLDRNHHMPKGSRKNVIPQKGPCTCTACTACTMKLQLGRMVRFHMGGGISLTRTSGVGSPSRARWEDLWTRFSASSARAKRQTQTKI